MAGEVLTRRELNRTLLGRQLLLRRRRMAAADAVEHLVGMQAQNPLDPYFGLWSRLDDFDPEELSKLVSSREAVRAWLMRGTIHLVTARDCLAFRPVMDSVLRAALTAQQFGRDTAGVDRDELRAAAEAVLADEPMTRAELGRSLTERWPAVEAESLGLAASCVVPLLQVPPRGTWGATHRATMARIETFLGRPIGRNDDPGETRVSGRTCDSVAHSRCQSGASRDSNRRPRRCKRRALPTELWPLAPDCRSLHRPFTRRADG